MYILLISDIFFNVNFIVLKILKLIVKSGLGAGAEGILKLLSIPRREQNTSIPTVISGEVI